MTTTKRYRLPDALGGGEVEAVLYQFPHRTINRNQYRGDGFALWVDAPLTEVPPPVPDEPKAEVGNLAYFVDRYGLPWHNSIHHGKWESAGCAPTAWQDLWNSAGPLVPLIPDPAHGVTLPWVGTDNYGDRIEVTPRRPGRPGCIFVSIEDGGDVHEAEIGPDRAAELAGALLAAARTAREATP